MKDKDYERQWEVTKITEKHIHASRYCWPKEYLQYACRVDKLTVVKEQTNE